MKAKHCDSIMSENVQTELYFTQKQNDKDGDLLYKFYPIFLLVLALKVAGRRCWGYRAKGVKNQPTGQETSLSGAGSAPAFGGRPWYSQDLSCLCKYSKTLLI